MTIYEFIISEFLPALQDRFFDLLLAPINNPEMFWILFPLVTIVILFELYFGRYPREQIGYHGALESTVFLLFVGVDLVRYLILEHQAITEVKTAIILVIIFYAFIMSILDFFHKIPRHIAFKINSKFFNGFMAYMGIILVYSDALNNITPLSIATTIFSLIMIFVIFKLFITVLQTIEPKAHDEVEEILQNVEEEIEKAAKESKRH